MPTETRIFFKVRALWIGLLGVGILLCVFSGGQRHSTAFGATIPPLAPVLVNADFECAAGYTESLNGAGETIRTPDGWTYTALDGAPIANSARIQFANACDSDSAHVERISGRDSFVVRAQDLETPPEPGKPFDIALAQQVNVITGGDYSLSSWMLSLCGGSAVPSDCPEDVAIIKMLGLDPTGGTNPEADTVIWVEDRRNFVDGDNNRIGWSNLRLGAVARTERMTIFARIRSPQRWHGNHAFIDAISFVRAPIVDFVDLANTVSARALTVTWEGTQSPDIAAIPGGTHELRYDLQARLHTDSTWSTLLADSHSTSLDFVAPCSQTSYQFRLRVRAEQPPAPPEGAVPNQRYPGSWSTPQTVNFVGAATTGSIAQRPAGAIRLYLPVVVATRDCSVRSTQG